MSEPVTLAQIAELEQQPAWRAYLEDLSQERTALLSQQMAAARKGAAIESAYLQGQLDMLDKKIHWSHDAVDTLVRTEGA